PKNGPQSRANQKPHPEASDQYSTAAAFGGCLPWIEAQAQLKPVSDMDRLPTSKQVAFAEKLARIKRRAVPDECFRDKGLMSKWIDGNK
ncbi:hypothetical protein C8N33_116117, partial [Pararhodobacter aggregans]